MVEAATKQHPVVNLDEFERRLRSPAMTARDGDDPLAELARLVNGEGPRPSHDPYKAMFAGAAAVRAAQASPPGANHQPGSGEVVRLPVASWDRHEPVPMPEVHHGHASAPGGADPQDAFDPNDQQAIFEREMRALQAEGHRLSLHDEQLQDNVQQPAAAAQHDHQAGADGDHERHGLGQEAGAQVQDDDFHREIAASAPVWQPKSTKPARPAQASSRRPTLIMGAIACVGLVAIGGTFAMRANGAAGTKPIATIMAPDEPVKIAPKIPGGTVVANLDAAILDKATGAKVSADVITPRKVASQDEQPIDLSQVPKPAKAAVPAGQPNTIAVAPPAPVVAAPPPAAATVGAIFGEPKRVKSVQVRPDGSLVGGAATPVPPVNPGLGIQASATTASATPPVMILAAPPPPTPIIRPSVTALPVTVPSAAPPTPAPKVAAAPKATVRAIAIGKPDSKVGAAAPVAAAPVADDPNAPMQLVPSKAKAPKIKVADASSTIAAAPARDVTGSSGNFSVQLAAPTTDQEARDVSARFQKQYASALDGHQPSIRTGDSNGKQVHRVRIVNLTRDDANAICAKLKASGGACFVAGN